VNVGMAIACAGRHVEIHRRGRLGRFGKDRSGVHDDSGRHGSEQNIASRWHGFPPGVESYQAIIYHATTGGGLPPNMAVE
jgi:hypothetical protein